MADNTTSEVVEDEDPDPVVIPAETVSAPLLVGTPMSKRLFLASTKAPVVSEALSLEDILTEE